MRKFIITGANGFIGSHLCKFLCEQGDTVYAIVRNHDSNIEKIKDLDNIVIVYCDIFEIERLKEMVPVHSYDGFIHLGWAGAGGSKREDVELQAQNILASVQAQRTAYELGCQKFIGIGTISERLDEFAANRESNSANMIYGQCKKITKKLQLSFASQKNFPTVWLCCANVFGPGSINGNIIQYTLLKLLRGETAEFSNAESLYDFIYIEDLIKCIYSIAINRNKKAEYYIGTGKPRILKDFIIEIANNMNQLKNVKFGVRADENILYLEEWFDNDEYTKEYGLPTNSAFIDCINETLAWLKELETCQ